MRIVNSISKQGIVVVVLATTIVVSIIISSSIITVAEAFTTTTTRTTIPIKHSFTSIIGKRLNNNNNNENFLKTTTIKKKNKNNALYMSHHEHAVTEASNMMITSFGILDPLLQSSAFWSSLLMLSIVGLLYTWENTVENARERLPKTLMPVLDSMLAEMGGLGFIGLFLGVAVIGGPLGSIIGEFSEHFLGDEEILLETFEFLHTAFFEVAVGFFLIAGVTVAKVLKQIDSLSELSVAVFDKDGDGEVSLDELADALNVDSVAVDLDGDGQLDENEIKQAMRIAKKDSFIDELFMSSKQIKAEALVVRERFIQTCRVDTKFRIEAYFTRIFGSNLEEIVELSPLTWLPLIPAISLGRSVDMSRDVVSASSSNAYESCGYFLGSPEFFITSTAFAALSLVWGWFNFWKMTEIKKMLIPTLVYDTQSDNAAQLLPPRYEDNGLRTEFNSSPGIVSIIEKQFCYNKPPRNTHEELFGAAGAAGPHFYLNSIKFQTWLVVSQIVFWGTQIVTRDIAAIVQEQPVGNPELIIPELIIFGIYVLSAIIQLWLAPQTFLNYSLITSIEELTNEYIVKESCKEYGNDENTPQPVSKVNEVIISK